MAKKQMCLLWRLEQWRCVGLVGLILDPRKMSEWCVSYLMSN